MSTRKLILLALACGLAILVAGSIQLLRIQRGDSSTLAVGDSTEVATVTVSVLDAGASGDRVLVKVRLRIAATASSPLENALVGWSLLTGGLKEPVLAVDASAEATDSVPSCAGLRLVAGETRECWIAFPTKLGGAGTTYVSYRFAGQQAATWSLPL